VQFTDVVGQGATKALFLQAAHSGRLPHALLLRGPAGAGKLPLLLAAIHYLLCENPTSDDSCGQCSSCSKLRQGIHPDVHYVAPIFLQTVAGKSTTTADYIAEFRKQVLAQPYSTLNAWGGALEAENKQLVIGIHEMRELRRKLGMMAYEGRKKIAVIWHTEKINNEGANAFLKLLEEPPDDTHILLTAEDPAQLLPTLQSRCQTLRLPPLKQAEIQAYLQAHGVAAPAAQEQAALAEGSLSTALENQQHAADGLQQNFMQWMRLCYEGKFSSIHGWAESMASESREGQKLFLKFALRKYRDVLLQLTGSTGLLHLTVEELGFVQNFSKTLTLQGVERAADLLEQSTYNLQRNAHPTLTWLHLSLNLHRGFKRGRG